MYLMIHRLLQKSYVEQAFFPSCLSQILSCESKVWPWHIHKLLFVTSRLEDLEAATSLESRKLF